MNRTMLNIHTARLAAVLLAIGVLFAQVPSIAGANAPEPHGHVLLIRADFSENPNYPTAPGPRLFIHDYDRCVTLANGQRLPNHVHHDSIHTGQAGWNIESRTGNLVVPLAPVSPFTSCAHLDAIYKQD